MKYQLSISILVSNHVDSIRKCIESIKPLLDELRAELIIVDTGSIDGSIEIAREYADKIIPFAWCNDFSAARNVGLKAAQGDWFLYLDDDEWFEDVSEIIHFFKQEDYMAYGRAFYVQRNYADFDGANYSDSYVFRMFRIVENIHFMYRIHEMVNVELNPLKVFDSYVHHYGYIGKNEEKTKRNIALLEMELKDNPKDMRMLAQIINEYCAVGEYGKVLDLRDILDSIERSKVNDAMYCYAQVKIVECYYQLEQIQEVIRYTDSILQKGLYNKVTEAYLYIVLVYTYLDKEGQSEENNKMALRSFEQYIRCIKNQSLDKETFSQTALFGMGNIFESAYAKKVVQILLQGLNSAHEQEALGEILKKYNVRLHKENELDVSQKEDIKNRFLLAIQTLLDAGQLEVALQSLNQAIEIMGNDPDMQSIKRLIEEAMSE